MTQYNLVIRNGTAVTATHTFPADIAINGQTIVAIGQNLNGRKEIDATDKLVIPGGIDIHVHLQMPIGDLTTVDDFYSGTRAAAFGGTTTIVDFVERQPNQTMVEAIADRRVLADPRVVIDYALHMTISPSDIPHLDQIPAAHAAGCTSYKMYMAYGHCLDDGQMMLALEAIRDVGGHPVIHAENWDVITTIIERNLALGRTTPHWHPRSRPAITEGEATGRVIDIATLVDIPVHIFHVSCQEAVQRIANARQNGRPVTGETCPQYLFLTQEVYDAEGVTGTLPVCSPPIRDQAQQDALWHALANNHLQVVSTDHCGFTQENKALGLDNYSQIPGGVPGIQMRVSALYSKGVREGIITLNQWVDMCSTTPARVVGLANKGDICVGLDADLVIFDPEKEMTISADSIEEQSGWTPYEGMTLHGSPTMTISRGQIIVDDGQFKGEVGCGQFVKR